MRENRECFKISDHATRPFDGNHRLAMFGYHATFDNSRSNGSTMRLESLKKFGPCILSFQQFLCRVRADSLEEGCAPSVCTQQVDKLLSTYAIN